MTNREAVDGILGFTPTQGGFFSVFEDKPRVGERQLLTVCEHNDCYSYISVTVSDDVLAPDELLDALDGHGWGVIFCPTHKYKAVVTVEQLRRGYDDRE